MQFIDGSTVLITGGTGSIGSEIVRQVLETDVKTVIIFNRDEIKQYMIKQELDDQRLVFLMGDIRDYDSIQGVFEKWQIDYVFHTAAMKHLVVCENEPIECTYTNIYGTHNLIRLCVKYNVKKTLMISTDKAASPTSVMGATKFIAERITLNGNELSHFGSKFCVVRFGNVSSSRGSIIPVMTSRLMKGNDLWISDPDATRFIIRISQAVELVFRAMELTKGGEIFILKMKAFRVGDMGEVFRDRIAPKLGRLADLEKRNLVPGEKLHEDLLNNVEFMNLMCDEKMFITSTNNNMNIGEYPGFDKCSINQYVSSKADLLTLDEIEELIMEYLNQKGYFGG